MKRTEPLQEKVAPSLGPWLVDPNCPTWISARNPYGHGLMHVADVRGWGHLTGSGACDFKPEVGEAIQEANARLIAGAPDMAGAVMAAIDRLERGFLQDAIALLRTALHDSIDPGIVEEIMIAANLQGVAAAHRLVHGKAVPK